MNESRRHPVSVGYRLQRQFESCDSSRFLTRGAWRQKSWLCEETANCWCCSLCKWQIGKLLNSWMELGYCLILKHSRRSHRNCTEAQAGQCGVGGGKCFRGKKRQLSNCYSESIHAHISWSLMPCVCFKYRFDPKAHIDVCFLHFDVEWDAFVCDMDGSKTTKGNESLLGSSRKLSVVTKSGGHWRIWVWRTK